MPAIKFKVKSGVCGKIGYPDFEQAFESLMEIRDIRTYRRKQKRERSVYPCVCGYWHLTKKLQDFDEWNAPDLSFAERRRA